jgi:putative MATE family efflux protein
MNTTTAPVSTVAPPVLWKMYLAFLAPMILSNILQALSGTINNIYIGQMLGVSSMAAVSSFFPIFFFFIALMIGLGSGASVLIGQAWGAKEPERARAIAGTTLMLGLYAGGLVAVLGGVFAQHMLALLGTPADILPEATLYARIMLVGAPFIFSFILATSMLRGVSDTRSPLYALLLSTVVGLALTPALIRGWLGLPAMGVESAAIAGAVGCISSLVWLAWWLRGQQHVFAPNAQLWQHLRLDRAIMGKVFKIGLPTVLSMMTVSIAEIAVLFLVNRYGSQATAAYGAVNQIVSYVQFPAISIAITASILGAQAIGAGRGHTLGKIASTGIGLNVLLTGGLVLLGLVFSRSIIGLFITDPAVVEMAQTLLHIMLWSTVILGMSMVLSGLMRASGSVMVPTLLTMLAIGGIEIPAAWWLSQHYGLNGVWAGYPIAFTALLLMQTAYYQLVWKKKPIKRL